MSPEAFFIAQQTVVFLVGLCLGSFFNVVIHRLPNRQSLIRPGSHCPHCDRAIAAYDNIPLLSYLILGGKCRHCRATISVRYPIVEAITGLAVWFLFRRYGWHFQFFIESFFVSVLIVISFIDLDTFLIPDVLSLSGIVVGFLCSFVTPRLTWLDSLLGVVIGGGAFYLIAWLYQVLRSKEGLGGGDIKLLAMIGAFVGLPGVVLTILVSSVVGTIVGIFVMWRSRQGMTAMIPFGPFLSLGAVIYLFWGQAFYYWYFTDILKR